ETKEKARLAAQPIEEEPEKPKKAGKMAEDVYNRLKWDNSLDKETIVVGYEDRFLGIQEVPYNSFAEMRDLTGEVFIPWHRIRYFKNGEDTLWSREEKHVKMPENTEE
ncbi:poly(A) polymerase pla1, partial [Planoprotostelium fungivorum]